jgi:hypothetical protein
MTWQFNNDKTMRSGVVFVAIGGAALWFDQRYRLGDATAMGPGYFPMLIGILLVGLGLGNIVRSFRSVERAPMTRPALRPLLLLTGGVVLFGLFIDRFGLLPSVFFLVTGCCFAGPRFQILEALAMLIVLSAIAASLFVFGLGRPIGYLIRL